MKRKLRGLSGCNKRLYFSILPLGGGGGMWVKMYYPILSESPSVPSTTLSPPLWLLLRMSPIMVPHFVC
jgi:hypothetical protein